MSNLFHLPNINFSYHQPQCHPRNGRINKKMQPPAFFYYFLSLLPSYVRISPSALCCQNIHESSMQEEKLCFECFIFTFALVDRKSAEGPQLIGSRLFPIKSWWLKISKFRWKWRVSHILSYYHPIQQGTKSLSDDVSSVDIIFQADASPANERSRNIE